MTDYQQYSDHDLFEYVRKELYSPQFSILAGNTEEAPEPITLSAGSPFIGFYEGEIKALSVADMIDILGLDMSITLDDAYNASAGASTVNVDAGHLTWDISGGYDFIIDIDTGVAEQLHGFIVRDSAGTDYFKLLIPSPPTSLSLLAELYTVAFNTELSFGVTALGGLTLSGRSASLTGTAEGVTVGATSSTLTLRTVTSGTLAITSAALLDIDAAANIDIDVTGTFDMLATTTFSIDGTGASNVSATAGNLTLSTITTGSLLLQTSAAGNYGIGTSSFATSELGFIAMASGTLPTAAWPIDVAHIGVFDRGGTAGKAAVHLYCEDGTGHVFGDYVGIGTVAPAYKLDVAGDINVLAASAYKYNGVNVIRAQTALNNWWFGNGGNLTASGTGDVVIGNGGTALTSGHSDIIIGLGAGAAITSGNENIAIGAAALKDVTTTHSNVAIGANALYVCVGSYNVGLGGATLKACTSGARNMAIGDAAFLNTVTSSDSIAIGASAGRYITGGATALTSATQCVYIGGSTKALADTITNEIVIGYDATGIGSNSAILGNSSIAKTQLQGSVGIKYATPATLLDQAQWSADAVGSYHTFSKSRHATVGSHTVVQDNDVIGGINFAPSDGTDFGTISAQIKAEVDDASPGASSIGGALVFSTAAGVGADDLTERLRIDAAGVVSGASLALKDQYLSAAIPLSQTGTTGLVGFTATSIVAGMNELKAGSVASAYGEMYMNANSTACVNETANIPILTRLWTTGSLSGWTFVAGTTGAITAFSNYGGTVPGTVRATSAAHGLVTGDVISIRGTTNYNGVFVVTRIDATYFYFTDTWVADDGASDWDKGAYLLAGASAAGTYSMNYAVQMNITIFISSDVILQTYVNATACDKCRCKQTFGTSGGTEVMAGNAILTIAAGDRVMLAVTCSNAAASPVISYGALNLHRL